MVSYHTSRPGPLVLDNVIWCYITQTASRPLVLDNVIMVSYHTSRPKPLVLDNVIIYGVISHKPSWTSCFRQCNNIWCHITQSAFKTSWFRQCNMVLYHSNGVQTSCFRQCNNGVISHKRRPRPLVLDNVIWYHITQGHHTQWEGSLTTSYHAGPWGCYEPIQCLLLRHQTISAPE